MTLNGDSTLNLPKFKRPRGSVAYGAALVCGFLIIVGLLVVNVQFKSDLQDEKDQVAAGRAAMLEAGKATEELLSYDYKTIDEDLARAVARTTGPFTKQLQTLEDKVVKPTALSKHVVTKTTVSDVAVVRQTPTTVNLLVFANQVTASKGAPTQQNTSRLAVTMKLVDGEWLVSALQPI